jgi:hypothetical protein
MVSVRKYRTKSSENILILYRLIELRNGLRCMLVTNNSHEEEEDEQSDPEDTE